jgi:hypothetical protein
MYVMPSLRWAVALLVAVGVWWGVPAAAPAQEVRVTIVVILATNQNTHVDCELKCIAREVQKKEPGLTGFRLEDTTRKTLTVGKKEAFPLIDKEVATVLVRQVRKKTENSHRVSLTVKPPCMGGIEYTTCCGKFFPILTRYRTQDKERLIIAIRVQACKDQNEK